MLGVGPLLGMGGGGGAVLGVAAWDGASAGAGVAAWVLGVGSLLR